MSEEARKNYRLQGKYSDKSLKYEDRKPRKSLEKRLKESPTEKETQEKKFLKRKSDGTKEGTSFNSKKNESLIEYQDNADYSFSQLEEIKKPIEIKTPGKFTLSNTENGESSVLYEPNFYTEDEARKLFDCLRNSTKWLDKNIVIHGVEYPQPRLVAWYGPLPYSYSGTTMEPAEMPDCVLAIKRRVEDYLKGKNINVELNSVLLNLYRNNKDSVSWHSDDEFTMGVCPTIASISLGETRKFEMRPKPNRYCEDEHEKKRDEYFVHLNNGSLIIMDGCMQDDWQHRVPKEYHDKEARINLTFRTVYKFENGSPYSDSRVNNYKPVDQEIPKNSSRTKIDLDEENFPPLSSISNTMNSKTAHKTYEKAGSCLPEIGMKTNKISEKESGNNYLNNESISKINDRINSSEEQWTVETPPSNKTTSRINDKINASEEEWVVKTPVVAKALFETNDDASTSQQEINTESLTSHRTFYDRDDVHEYVEDGDYETSSYQKPLTKTNGSANESKDLNIESLSNNRDYPEAINKVRNSENTAVKHTFSNQAPRNTKDLISAQDEEWNVTSLKNNSYSEFGEINKSHYNCYEESASISQLTPPESNNKSHKDWYDKSCNTQILSESDEINQLHEEKHEKTFESDKIHRSKEDYFEKPRRWRTPLESNKTYRSNENFQEKSHYRRTPLESNKTYRSNEDYFEKTRHWRTPLESNKTYRSSEDFQEKSRYRRTPLESNKTNKSHENRNVKSSYTIPNRFQSDNKYHEEKAAQPFNKIHAPLETNRYHRYNERGATEPFCNKNISRQEKNFKSDEVKRFDSHNIEKSTISNENLDDCEQKSDKNQDSSYRERRNESSNFAGRSMQRFSDIRSEPGSNRSNGWRPNVKAEEFIPGKIKKLSSEMDKCQSSVDIPTYGPLNLIDLRNYDADLMPSDDLKNYANALKLRVIERISEFESSDKEELEVLCEISDGNQTDRNQKIICSRICAIVNKMPENNPTVLRYRQQANYGNENHYIDRRYQDSS